MNLQLILSAVSLYEHDHDVLQTSVANKSRAQLFINRLKQQLISTKSTEMPSKSTEKPSEGTQNLIAIGSSLPHHDKDNIRARY